MTKDLRKQFWEEILELAKKDKDIIVLTGDLGFSFYEKFKLELPEQFINCGIAEQNMIGVAAGLALAGKKPYCYSNSIFLLGRGYEFVRDEVCYNKLPVKLIGTGAAGFLGFSHNWERGQEKSLLKSLPLTSYFPKNGEQLKKVLEKTINDFTYIRI